jgi:hypothetical protein
MFAHIVDLDIPLLNGSEIIFTRPHSLANPTQMGSREIPKNVHLGQHRMRGFDGTTIGFWARMSQSDAQDVIFNTARQGTTSTDQL